MSCMVVSFTHALVRCGSLRTGPCCAVRCRYTAEWADHVLAHLPFYLVLFPLFLDLVTQNAAFAAQQAAKHLKRAAKVRHCLA